MAPDKVWNALVNTGEPVTSLGMICLSLLLVFTEISEVDSLYFWDTWRALPAAVFA